MLSNVGYTTFLCYTGFLSSDKILEGHSNSIRPRREVEKGTKMSSVSGLHFQRFTGLTKWCVVKFTAQCNTTRVKVPYVIAKNVDPDS